MLIYFIFDGERERERECANGGGAEREGEPSRLWAATTEPDAELQPMNPQFMTWAKVQGSSDWATQAPQEEQSFITCNFYNGEAFRDFLILSSSKISGKQFDWLILGQLHIPREINYGHKYGSASGGYIDITKEGFQEKCKIITGKNLYRDPLQTWNVNIANANNHKHKCHK